MLLHWAEFKNFRLLRDVHIEFARGATQPVTVIRAANESGKTTILTGLQWAFFGDDVLPKPVAGTPYRLHPIDWNSFEKPQVEIEAQIEFEVTHTKTLSDNSSFSVTDVYLLSRKVSEEVDSDGNGKRLSNHLSVFQVTDGGYEPVKNPNALIVDVIPVDLREVFFTDGDRALVFIEAHKDLKRQKVEKAIKGLLGVDLMESVSEHVRSALRDIRRKIKESGENAALSELITKQEKLDEKDQQTKQELADVIDQLARVGTQVQELETKITNALRMGDRDDVARQLEQASTRLKEARNRVGQVSKQYSDLLKDDHLALSLLQAHVERAAEKLASLKQKGTIPKTFLPILQQRLDLGVCICGASLAEGTSERDHVRHLMEQNKLQDETLDRLTTLNVGAARYLDILGKEEGSWTARCLEVEKRRAQAQADMRHAEEVVRDLEAQVARIPENDVATLQKEKRNALETEKTLEKRRALAEAELRGFERDKAELTQQIDRLTKSQAKLRRQLAAQRAADDVLAVVAGTFNELKTTKLSEVSEEMNRLFLEIINADPQQNSIIREASITSDYDLIVTGPDGRRLDPDVDLNGASKRALTLAFILALTKVSQVEAPNVIDTPLGMTAGEVKRSMFRVAAEHSAQLVLFLTRDEIAGVGDLITKYAGRVQTLTNTAHYPKMLLNDPHSTCMESRVCDCNHETTCELCARTMDVAEHELVAV